MKKKSAPASSSPRRFVLEPLEERIMLSAGPGLLPRIDEVVANHASEVFTPSSDESRLTQNGIGDSGLATAFVVQPIVDTLAPAMIELNAALAHWQTQFTHNLPFLPTELGELFDLSATGAALPFVADGIDSAEALINHLQDLGLNVDGFADGQFSGDTWIPAANSGLRLEASGEINLFADRAVLGGFDGERLNDAFETILRGFASELDLTSNVDWRANLRLAIRFSVTDEGAFVLGEGTHLVLRVTADVAAVTGTVKHAGLTLTPDGTLSADYRLTLALRDTSVGESLSTLSTASETHFRQYADGVASLSLAGTLEATTWQLVQTFTATDQEDGVGTTLTTADSLTIELPLPGRSEPIVLSGEYDSITDVWNLRANRVLLAPFGEVNLSATLSPAGLQGTLSGSFEGNGIEIRDASTGEPLIFNFGFNAGTIGGTFTAQNVTAIIRDTDDATVTKTGKADLILELETTSLTSDSLAPSLELSAESFSLGDGENVARLHSDGASSVLTSIIDLTSATLQFPEANLVATPMPGVTLRANLGQTFLDLQGPVSDPISVDAVLEIAALTTNGTVMAVAGTLQWDRKLWSFTPQQTTHTIQTGKFVNELSIFNSKLTVDALTYSDTTGWIGTIAWQSAVAYLWIGGSQVPGAILPSSGGSPGALTGTLDLASGETTLDFDGLRLSLGSMATVTLPAFSSTFIGAENLPEILATVNGTRVGSRQIAGSNDVAVDGVKVTRTSVIVPAFQQTLTGAVKVDNTLFLQDSQFGSNEGFSISNNGGSSHITGSLEAHSATGALAMNSAVTVIGAGATLNLGATDPAATLSMKADRVYVDLGEGRQFRFDNMPVSGTSKPLEMSGQRATVLENGAITGTQTVHQLVLQRDGQLLLQENSPNLLQATEILLGGLIPFAISGSEATATSGVYSATGVFDFSAFTQAGFAISITVGGVTYSMADEPAPLTLKVIENANGAALLDSGEIGLQINGIAIGELAEVNLNVALGAYVGGEWQVDGTGTAQLRFKDAFENHESGFFNGAVSLTQVAGVWRFNGVIEAILKTSLFNAGTVPLTFALDLTQQADGLVLAAANLSNTNPVEFSLSPDPKVSLSWTNALFDFSVTGDSPLVTSTELVAKVVLDSVQLRTEFEGLIINAHGDLGLAEDGEFRIAFGGLEDSNLLDEVKWPNWLPIQINTFVLEWENILSDWTDFLVVLSAEARTDFGDSLKMGLSGSISGLVLDFGLLDEGKFPFVAIDEVALQVGGGIAALPVEGRAILGLLRLDSNGVVIPTADRSTPVSETVLYAAINGSITLKGYGLGLYLGLSSYGPLGGYISASAPIPVGGPTGFVLGGLRGGIHFFSETPEIDDAATLDDNTVPAITPIANQSFGVWRQGFQQQLRDQVAAFNEPTSLAALNAILTAPFRIEGGGTFFNIYSSRNAFEANVDVILDSSGTLTLAGTLQMLSLPTEGNSQKWKSLNKYLAWFHFDISDALTQGEVDILAHIKQEAVFSKVAFSAWGSLELDFGATIDPANPPEVPFENITLRLNGGLGFSLFTYEFVRFDGTVEIGANFSEPRLIIGFSGDVSLVGVKEALGPLNAGAGRFEIFFDDEGVAQTIGAIELGNIIELPFGDIAGVAIGGQAVLRLNTTGDVIDFEVPSLADPAIVRTVSLAANTGDLFIEGGIALDVVGIADLNMTGQFSVGFRSEGLFVYARGAIYGFLLGGNRLAQGWDYSAEALFNLSFDGIAPGIAATFRLQTDDRQRYSQIPNPAGGPDATIDLTMQGALIGTVNTTGREVSFEVPTEHTGLFGERTVVIPAGMTRGDGTLANAGAYVSFVGSGLVRFNDWLETNGRIYLGHTSGEAASLELDGSTMMQVGDEEVITFEAKGRFLLDEGGLYGSLVAITDAQTPFVFDQAIAPVNFTGSLRLAVNSTGIAQDIDGMAVEAGRYARLVHTGVLNIDGFVSTGTHTFELLPNESIRVSFDSTLTAAVAAGDLFGFRATGSVIIVDTGIYGELGLTVANEFTPVNGWEVSLAGNIRFQLNTTLEERNSLPANLGTRITVAGALLIGDQATITGTHYIQAADDTLTLDLNGVIDLHAEDEQGQLQTLLSLPVDVTFDVDTPVIQKSFNLNLANDHSLFREMGFEETSTVALEINTSTAAPAGGSVQGPYARIAINGALLRSGQALTGQFYLYQDVRTIRANGDVDLLLRAGDATLMHFELDLVMQLSFAGLAGWARGGVKEILLPNNLLQDIGNAEFTLTFNTDVDEAVIPREGNPDVTVRGGPFFEVTTNGNFNLAGVQTNGDLTFVANVEEVQLALDGDLRILIPETADVFYEARTEGRFFLNSNGLYGALELEDGLEIPYSLGFAFQEDPAQKVRLAINTTGKAHQLTETLKLEAGNYARLNVSGSLLLEGFSMVGNLVIEVADRELTVDLNGVARLFIPNGGEGQTLMTYAVVGSAAIYRDGLAGKIVLETQFGTDLANSSLASVGIALQPSTGTTRVELNTTNRLVTTAAGTLEAGRYGRLITEGNLDLGLATYEGTFIFQMGQYGLELLLETEVGFGLPANGLFAARNLITLDVVGGLRVTADGVAGILSIIQTVGDTDSFEINGFKIGLRDVQSGSYEINFTNKEQIFSTRTLAAGKYVALRGVGSYSADLGALQYAGQMPEFYLQLAADGLTYVGFAQESLTMDNGSDSVITLYEASAQVSYFINQNGVYGFKVAQAGINLSGLSELGLDITPTAGAAIEEYYTINFTGAEQTVEYNSTTRTLKADELISFSQRGIIGVGYDGNNNAALVGVSGLISFSVRNDGLQAQISGTATVLGKEVEVNGLLRPSILGLLGYLDLDTPDFALGNIATVAGEFEIAINTTSQDATFIKLNPDLSSEEMTIEAGSFRINVADATINIAGNDLLSGDFFFARDGNGIWKGVIGDADAPFDVNLLPGITATARGFLAEDGTHDFRGTVDVDFNTGDLVTIDATTTFSFIQETVNDTPTGLIVLAGTMNLLGSPAPITGIITRSGDDWEVDIEAVSVPLGKVEYKGRAQLVYKGQELQFARLGGHLEIGGIDISGDHILRKVDGVTSIKIDGDASLLLRDDDPATDDANEEDLLFSLTIDGELIGQELPDGSTEWYGAIIAQTNDSIDLAARLRGLGIDIDSTKLTFTFQTNTTGTAQFVTLPNDSRVDLEAGNYSRFHYNGDFGLGLLEGNGDILIEKTGDAVRAFIGIHTRLETPGLGAIPSQEIVSYFARGYLAITSDGVGGRLNLEGGLLQNGADWIRFIKGEEISGVLDINLTGKSLVLNEEVTLPGPSFVQLTVNAEAQFLAFSTAVMSGEYKFRLATNAIEVFVDTQLRVGFPANDAFDLYLTVGTKGTFVADYRGVHGLLDATPNSGAGSKPEMGINLSAEAGQRLVLNTTGEDIVIGDVTLSADRKFGLELVADLSFILGNYAGDVFIGITSDSLLFDLDGDLTAFTGHQLAVDGILEARADGLRFLTQATFPDLNIGGDNGLTLNGAAFIRLNTTDEAFSIETGDVIPPNTAEIRLRELNLSLTPLLELSGNAAFGRVDGAWIGIIDPAQPLTAQFLGIETVVNGSLNLPDSGEATWNLTSTTAINLGNNDFGLVGDIRMTSNQTEGTCLVFNGSLNGLVHLAEIEGEILLNDDGFSLIIDAEALAIAGYGATGKFALRYTQSTGVLRFEAAENFVLNLPVIGDVSISGYAQSDGDIDLQGVANLSLGNRDVVALEDSLNVSITGFDQFDAIFGGKIYLAGQEIVGETTRVTFNDDTFTLRRDIGLNLINGYQTSGALTITAGIDATNAPYIRAETLGTDTLQIALPIFGDAAFTGSFDTRGLAVTLTAAVSHEQAVGLASDARVTASVSGQIGVSYNVNETEWSLILAGNYDIQAMGAVESGSINRNWGGEDISFTLSGPFNFAGFTLNGNVDVLLDKNTVNLRIDDSRPLILNHPVFGSIDFRGYFNSPSDFALIGSAEVTTGAGLPIELAGTSAFILRPSGMEGNFTGTLRTGNVTQTITQTAFIFNASDFSFETTPLALEIGGFAINGTYALSVRDNGTGGKNFSITVENAELAIPTLGSASVSGNFDNSGNIALSGNVGLDLGVDGLLALDGFASVSMSNNSFTATVSGSVNLLGTMTDSIAATASITPGRVDFQVTNIKSSLGGLELAGGFGLTVETDGTVPVVTARMGDDVGLLRLDSPFFGNVEFSGDIDVGKRTVSLTGEAQIDWSASSSEPNFLRLLGDSTFAVVGSIGTFELQVTHQQTLYLFGATQALNFTTSFRNNELFAEVSGAWNLGFASGNGLLQLRANGSGFTLTIPDAQPLTTTFLGASAAISGSWSGTGTGVSWNNIRLISSLNLGLSSAVNFNGSATLTANGNGTTGSFTGSITSPAGSNAVTNLAFHSDLSTYIEFAATSLNISLGGLTTNASGVYRFERGQAGTADYHRFALAITPGSSTVVMRGGDSIDMLPSLDLSGGYTIETWINLDSINGDRAIFGKLLTETAVSELMHLIVRNGKLHQGHYADDLTGTTTLETGRWYHVAFTYDASSGTQAIYLDGALEASRHVDRPLNDDAHGLYRIGATIGPNFDGQLDNFRIWAHARSAEEIAFNQTVILPSEREGLLYSLPFENGAGSAIRNAGSANGLTFSGTPEWAQNASTATLNVPGVGNITGAGYFDVGGNYFVAGSLAIDVGDSNVGINGNLKVIATKDGLTGRFNGQVNFFRTHSSVSGTVSLENGKLAIALDTLTTSFLGASFTGSGKVLIDGSDVRIETQNLTGSLAVFGSVTFTGWIDTALVSHSFTAAATYNTQQGEYWNQASLVGTASLSVRWENERWGIHADNQFTATVFGHAQSFHNSAFFNGYSLAFSMGGEFTLGVFASQFRATGAATVEVGPNTFRFAIHDNQPLVADFGIGRVEFRGTATSFSDFTLTSSASISLGTNATIRIAGNTNIYFRMANDLTELGADFSGSVTILDSELANATGTVDITSTSFQIFTSAQFDIGGFQATGSLYIQYYDSFGFWDRDVLIVSLEHWNGGSHPQGDLSIDIPGVGDATLTGSRLKYVGSSGEFTSDFAGELTLNIDLGIIKAIGSGLMTFDPGQNRFTADWNGSVTVFNATSAINGQLILGTSNNNFTIKAQLAVDIGGGLQASGLYKIEFGDNYARATAQNVLLNLPGLSNSQISVDIDTNGIFRASGDIDLSLGDQRYASLVGTLRFSADQNSASAVFYYTAHAGNTFIGSSPYGTSVSFNAGQFTLDLHSPGQHLYVISLFDFYAWMERFTFSIGAQGLYVNVGGAATYHDTGGGSLSGYIDLRNGGLAFSFDGRFSVSGSIGTASAEGSLDITMRSASSGESAIWVGDWGIVIYGSARGSGRIWPGPDVSVSASLDLSRWRLTFDVLGTDVTIQL